MAGRLVHRSLRTLYPQVVAGLVAAAEKAEKAEKQAADARETS
jgi:hypothetical protein